eukprot:1729366-Amphidinium_carterae.1
MDTTQQTQKEPQSKQVFLCFYSVLIKDESSPRVNFMQACDSKEARTHGAALCPLSVATAQLKYRNSGT